jgi:hypothetical protein
MVGDAGVIRARWCWSRARRPTTASAGSIDIGKFSGLAGPWARASEYRLRTGRDGTRVGPVVLAARPATRPTSSMRRPVQAAAVAQAGDKVRDPLDQRLRRPTRRWPSTLPALEGDLHLTLLKVFSSLLSPVALRRGQKRLRGRGRGGATRVDSPSPNLSP